MPATFMRLPLEIRQLIYKECLRYDGVLTPYPTQFNIDEGLGAFSKGESDLTQTSLTYITQLERDQGLRRGFSNWNEKPTMGLLAVNRQVRSEAKDYFTRVNLWRWKFRHSDRIVGSHFKVPQHSQWRVRQAFSPRHVVMSWDSRDLDPMDSIEIATESAVIFSRHGIMMEPANNFYEAREDFAHRRRWEALKAIWGSQMYLLRHNRNIRSVVIDVTNANCTGSCCRKFKEALVDTVSGKFNEKVRSHLSEQGCHSSPRSALSRHAKMTSSPQPETIAHNIKFIGLLDRTEKSLAHSCGFGCDDCQFLEEDRLTLVPCEEYARDRLKGLNEGLPTVEPEPKKWLCGD